MGRAAGPLGFWFSSGQLLHRFSCCRPQRTARYCCAQRTVQADKQSAKVRGEVAAVRQCVRSGEEYVCV